MGFLAHESDAVVAINRDYFKLQFRRWHQQTFEHDALSLDMSCAGFTESARRPSLSLSSLVLLYSAVDLGEGTE